MSHLQGGKNGNEYVLYDVGDFLADDSVVEVHFALVFVFDFAVFESEESVIAAETDILAGHDNGTSLSNENIADSSDFTRGKLNTQVIWS